MSTRKAHNVWTTALVCALLSGSSVGCQREVGHPAEAAVDASLSGTADGAAAAPPNADGAAKPLPSIADNESNENVEHHALVQKKVGFYAVFLPDDYETSGKRYPLVVILHGSGSTELRHGALANDFGRERAIYLAPRAPHAHHGVFLKGKSGWTAWPTYPEAWGDFDAPSFPRERIAGVDARVLYVEWIAATIEDARRRYRILNDRAVVYGHSQGAAFAHELAVQHPEMVKAYFAFAGYYESTTDEMDDVATATALKKHNVAISLVHNEGDPAVKVEQTKRLMAYFQRHQVEHEAHILPGELHYATPEIRRLARDFVQRWCERK